MSFVRICLENGVGAGDNYTHDQRAAQVPIPSCGHKQCFASSVSISYHHPQIKVASRSKALPAPAQPLDPRLERHSRCHVTAIGVINSVTHHGRRRIAGPVRPSPLCFLFLVDRCHRAIVATSISRVSSLTRWSVTRQFGCCSAVTKKRLFGRAVNVPDSTDR